MLSLMLLEKNDKRKDSLLPCVWSRREYMTSKCGKNKIEAYEACVTDVLTTSWPLCILLIPKWRPSEVSWVENTKVRHLGPKVASCSGNNVGVIANIDKPSNMDFNCFIWDEAKFCQWWRMSSSSRSSLVETNQNTCTVKPIVYYHIITI